MKQASTQQWRLESINGFNFLYLAGFLETIVVTQALMMNDPGEILCNKKYDDDIQKCSERKI